MTPVLVSEKTERPTSCSPVHGVLHWIEGFADDSESPTKHSPPFSIANNFLPACLAMLAQKAGLISEAE
jgi:hypothetical protein